MVIFVFAILAY